MILCAFCLTDHAKTPAAVRLVADRYGCEIVFLCQQHVDDWFDYADEGIAPEPMHVEWLTEPRTLVAA